MNTKIFKLIIAIIAVLFATAISTAQEAETMHVMENDSAAYQSAVSDVDTIISDSLSVTTPVIPEGGVLINGVVWASCNVTARGTFAANPEASGMFYRWNRKRSWSVTNPMTSYIGDATDDSTTSTGTTWEKSNDPSPSGWRLPTRGEQQTLLDTDKVTSEWVTQNGISGRKFTDKISGNSIFLPAVGYRDDSGALYGAGTSGYYWSSTALKFYEEYAYYLYFDSGSAECSYHNRDYGLSVRCVAE